MFFLHTWTEKQAFSRPLAHFLEIILFIYLFGPGRTGAFYKHVNRNIPERMIVAWIKPLVDVLFLIGGN